MEEKTSPVKSEEPKHTPKAVSFKSLLKNPLFPVVGVVVLVLVGVILFLVTRPSATPVTTQQPAENISATPAVPLSWQTYTDTAAGFSLKYPDSVLLNADLDKATKPVLQINAEKLSAIPEDLPLAMGRTDALKQKAALEKGQVENSIKISSLNGVPDLILGRFEVCSVILSRTLTFYPGDYRVIISLIGSKEAVMESMPEFFTIDKANCGDNRVWNLKKTPTFEQTLAQKKGRGAAQAWYDTYDAIVQTITLTTSSVTSPAPTKTISSLLTYKNVPYGFEISYPNPYRPLDSKADLSGYPKGIVLIYSGGQAYDVVVEVWNTKEEYESNYATRMADVTVVKSNGKFITLLNNTHAPENAQIIASFKLLP